MSDGNDFSQCQGLIDWSVFAASKFASFVILQSTSGCTGRDPTFDRNWRGAIDTGFQPSAYHFCYPDGDASDAKLEARNMSDAVMRAGICEDTTLWQDLENKACPLFGDAFLRWVLDFSDTTEAITGRKTGLCTGKYWWQDHTKGASKELVLRCAELPLWLMAYVGNPNEFVPEPWLQWDIWQRRGNVCATGDSPLHVEGILGPVDHDIARTPIADLARRLYLRSIPGVMPEPESVSATPFGWEDRALADLT